MYAVTGASGRLGRLVIEALLSSHDPGQIVALVRDPAKVKEVADGGVAVRPFDYDDPSTLAPGLEGVERVLLVSGSEIGRREHQHRAVIDSARAAGVRFLAYTSVLHADNNPIGLAREHRATEAAVKQSGLAYALLRHGWYTENYTTNAAMEIARGTVIGSAGSGRLSTATRADYAAGDAAVLLDKSVFCTTYELAGDDGFTLADYAAALSAASGRPVTYRNLPEADYRASLVSAGLPARIASLLAESSAASATDVMFEDGRALSRLLGRPTTPMRETVATAVDERNRS